MNWSMNRSGPGGQEEALAGGSPFDVIKQGSQ